MPDKTITNPEYKEWPEANYSHGAQFKKNIKMFDKSNKILYRPTGFIYTYIRDYCIDYVRNHPQFPSKFIWKPKIIDVGCGGGFGSYVLSQESDFVYGIDMDEDSIRWAKEVFEKHKNGVYYSSQLTFEIMDIRTENREIMKFDIVVCVEVIEHIADYNKVLEFLKARCKQDKKGNFTEPPNATAVFISSPNRNHPKIGKENPKNKLHVREWTPAELYGILTKHFKYVTCMTPKGEPAELNMTEDVVLFKCEVPILQSTE